MLNAVKISKILKKDKTMQYVQLTLYKWFISSVWKDMHSNTIKQKYHLPAHVVVYKQYIYTMKFIYHFYFGFKTSQHVHKIREFSHSKKLQYFLGSISEKR